MDIKKISKTTAEAYADEVQETARLMREKHGPGFRYFKCDECGNEWISASRDRNSPSGEQCIGMMDEDPGVFCLRLCTEWVMATPATTEQYDRLHKT